MLPNTSKPNLHFRLNKFFVQQLYNLFVVKLRLFMREPWSSGYGRRLMSKRLWNRIPAMDTGWTFFTYIVVKEAGVGPFIQKKLCQLQIR